MVEFLFKEFCEIVEQNKRLLEDLNDCEKRARGKNAGPNVDCQSELEKLQALLEERNEEIEKLLTKLNNQNANGTGSKPTDLDDASTKLRDLIKDLEAISGDIEKTVERKDQQLEEKQRIIDELRKQLKSGPEQLGSDQPSGDSMSESKEMEEQNRKLENQIEMLEEQLAALVDEHNQLLKNNDDLISSIIICQNAICQYEFE